MPPSWGMPGPDCWSIKGRVSLPQSPHCTSDKCLQVQWSCFSNYALSGDTDKTLQTMNVEETHKINGANQVQTFGNHQGRLKTHLTPSSPKLKVTYVFCLTPQTLTWQLPGVAAITREAWAPCHCVGCWSPFLGIDLFDGSWTTACSSENLGFNSSTSIN